MNQVNNNIGKVYSVISSYGIFKTQVEGLFKTREEADKYAATLTNCFVEESDFNTDLGIDDLTAEDQQAFYELIQAFIHLTNTKDS